MHQVLIERIFDYSNVYPTQASDDKRNSPLPSNPAHRATIDDFRTLPQMSSPRFVKTHLPLSLLPPKLLDTAKVFYIGREPRDVAVSFNFAHKLFKYFDDDVTFKEFWDLFKNDLIIHTPIMSHIEEAWRKRDQPNLLFLFYEEMQKDLPSVINRVCKFLGREYTEEQKKSLAEHLSFKNMKSRSKIDKERDNELSEKNFFRKGKSGNWMQYFDEDMKVESDEYMRRYLNKTDMRFPN